MVQQCGLRLIVLNLLFLSPWCFNHFFRKVSEKTKVVLEVYQFFNYPIFFSDKNLQMWKQSRYGSRLFKFQSNIFSFILILPAPIPEQKEKINLKFSHFFVLPQKVLWKVDLTIDNQFSGIKFLLQVWFVFMSDQFLKMMTFFRKCHQISVLILSELINFYSPLNLSKNHRFSNDFRGNRKKLIHSFILKTKFGDDP